MRLSLLICTFLVAATVGSLAPQARAASPALAAKQAQAKQVLAQIDAIDEQLSVVTERYDTANVALETLRKRVTAEKASLAVAQAQYRVAQKNVERLLVALYTNQRPTEIDVILGAKTLSDLLSLSEAESAISREQTDVVRAATTARRNVRDRLKALENDRTAAAGEVRELGQERSQIGRGLAQRRTLLSSVQAQINQIEARQRALQEKLAAEARARLAAQRAALLRQAEQEAKARREQAAARAKALRDAQRAAAAAAAAAATTTQSTTTAQASAGSSTATTTDPASAGISSTTAIPPVPELPPESLPGGHPEAATIALQYLGIPYLWGGSTPSGFDCSGLVSYVFAQLGVLLPHSAADQYGYGVNVPRADLQPGDLVFFDGLNHVGIYIGNNELVNAPDTGSFVRIDSLSEPWYANRYVGARRV